MRIIRSFISLYATILFSVMPLCSVCFAQSRQEATTPPINVASLLAETGYKYVEVRKGLWKIPELSYQGKNLKKLIIFLEPDPSNKYLRISAHLDFFPMSAATTQFKEKVDDLNKRFKPTEFLLSGTSLFAVANLPANKLDKKTLEKVIKEVGDVSDQAYPELAKFTEIEKKEIGKPSLGPGSGGGMGTGSGEGMGVGPGRGYNEPKSSETSKTNVARVVDVKPVMLSNVRPGYTEEARKNKVEGTVMLKVIVDETGQPQSIRVIRGLPDGLTEKAIEAAKKAKFKPAMKDGKAVAYMINLSITFTLR